MIELLTIEEMADRLRVCDQGCLRLMWNVRDAAAWLEAPAREEGGRDGSAAVQAVVWSRALPGAGQVPRPRGGNARIRARG